MVSLKHGDTIMDCKKDPATGAFKCTLRKGTSPLQIGSFTVVKGEEGVEVTEVHGPPDLIEECANTMIKYLEFHVV